MGPTGLQQGPGELQGVGRHDVVVGHAVDEEQRALQQSRLGAEVGTGVVARLRRRITEVPLRVVGVVEAPVGHRSACDRSVEHVGPT